MPHSGSERELIERVLAHDARALDEFVDRYWAFMRAVVRRATAGRVTAGEEVPQTVVLRLLEHDFRLLRRWRGDGPFASYLARIVRTTAADYFRDRYGAPVEPFPEDDYGRQPVAPGNDAEDALLEQERVDVLQALIAELSPADRELLQRKFWSTMTNPEIASQLGIELNALYQRLHRALRRLHRLAGERCPGLFPTHSPRGPRGPACRVRPGQPAASGD